MKYEHSHQTLEREGEREGEKMSEIPPIHRGKSVNYV